MSALQAMERSYSSLRRLLREGVFSPGHRLEANRLANDLGVSMTPVRDALNRLVGEHLVDANAGEGFHVPRLTEVNLRDLYEWHSALAMMVVRTAKVPLDTDDMRAALARRPLADATASVFALVAETAPNAELCEAMMNAGDRLHPFRLVESAVIRPPIDELEVLLCSPVPTPASIRRYHLIRIRSVPELLQARTSRK